MTEQEFDQAESFWDRKDAAEKKMNREEIYTWIDEFLSSHKILALATASEDFVRCTPLEYSWHDGALWIFTEGGKKFHGLRKNRHAAAAVFDPDGSFGGLQSLQIDGTVEFIDVDSEEYQSAAAFRHIPMETLRKLPEPMYLLKIIPSEIICLNSAFRKQGYGSRQVWR